MKTKQLREDLNSLSPSDRVFLISMVYFRKPLEHFLKAVDEVSAKDIASMAQKLISSPLTMASLGDGNFPFHKYCYKYPQYFLVELFPYFF